MAMIPITAATTAANATAEANARGYTSIVLSADNLAGAEVVNIYIHGSKAVTDSSGTVKTLTASIPAIELAGGVVYTVSKPVTAGACTIWMSPNMGITD